MDDLSAARTAVRPEDGPFAGLAVIAAVASNGVIGADGGLPWRMPDDLKRFCALTRGHAVIMGRRTWESLRGPLAGRQNIVVTSHAGYPAPGAEVVAGLDEALAAVRCPRPMFCIGGAGLYRDALPRAATMYLTEIARDFDGDIRFPPFARRRMAGNRSRNAPHRDGMRYDFVTYARVR